LGAVGNAGDPRAIAPLQAALLAHPDDLEMAVAAGQFRDPRLTGPLVQIMAKHPYHPEVEKVHAALQAVTRKDYGPHALLWQA